MSGETDLIQIMKVRVVNTVTVAERMVEAITDTTAYCGTHKIKSGSMSHPVGYYRFRQDTGIREGIRSLQARQCVRPRSDSSGFRAAASLILQGGSEGSSGVLLVCLRPHFICRSADLRRGAGDSAAAAGR